MTNFSETLVAIESKLKQLIRQKKEVKAELDETKGRLEELENNLATRSKELEELKEKNKILRIAGNNGESDNREIKLKINEIVREVDKCIAQLNQ